MATMWCIKGLETIAYYSPAVFTMFDFCHYLSMIFSLALVLIGGWRMTCPKVNSHVCSVVWNVLGDETL